MLVLFYVSLLVFVYTYIGYPVLLALLGAVRPQQVRRAHVLPPVSIIIVVHDEERAISAKLENTLALDYPEELREIIVVSDGSTDRTAQLIGLFVPAGIQCICLPEWQGKASALNKAVGLAKGDVLVFTDAGTLAAADCLKRLVMGFADPRVGCITAENRVIAQGVGGGEKSYISYLMQIRRLETRVGSCTSVSGPFYAARRDVCPVFSPHMPTDLISALHTVQKGFRVVSDPDARTSMGSVRTQREEFTRKVRTMIRGIACLVHMRRLLNPLAYGWFAVQLLSHKLLRWCCGVCMVGLMLSSISLADGSVAFAGILILQITAYALGVLGLVSERLAAKFIWIRIPSYVMLTHLAGLLAWWKYLRGDRAVVWDPSSRQLLDESMVTQNMP